MTLLRRYELYGPAAALAVGLLGYAYISIPGGRSSLMGLLLELGLFAFAGVMILSYAVLVLVRLAQRRRDQAIRAAVALLFTIVLLIVAQPFIYRGLNHARLTVSRSSYDAIIAAKHAVGKSPVIAAFDWGGYGWALVYTQRYPVFDETDEIAEGKPEKSAVWLAAAPPELKPVPSDEFPVSLVQSLGGHYYVVSITFQ